jgi:putative oxygen-independent coproporphyrinogen III oxidase
MTPPLALYVHLPWCVRKCPYCDFNSHQVPGSGVPEEAYLQALLEDLEHAAADCEGRPLISVFFGGGTPSLFSPSSIERLLSRASALLPMAPGLEVTLEANPGTIEHGAFAAYRAAGVNRVSLGAQSFDDRHLAALGRIHAAAETRTAVAELRAAGLVNFNLDLMYALPAQEVSEALADIEAALALEPAHLSHYQLTLEPGTVFASRPPPLPDEDASFAMQEVCQSRLADAGYAQYEVSAYARPGAQCRHNRNYWEFGDYLGVGAGAHGKLTRDGSITRTARHRSPARFMAAATTAARIAEERVIETAELPFEFCLNALRLVDGFDSETFEERTALPRSVIESACAKALERGLLEQTRQRWAPTPLGRRFLNDLQALFLTDGPAGTRVASRENHTGVGAPPRTAVAGGPEIGYWAETVIHTRPR